MALRDRCTEGWAASVRTGQRLYTHAARVGSFPREDRMTVRNWARKAVVLIVTPVLMVVGITSASAAPDRHLPYNSPPAQHMVHDSAS